MHACAANLSAYTAVIWCMSGGEKLVLSQFSVQKLAGLVVVCSFAYVQGWSEPYIREYGVSGHAV